MTERTDSEAKSKDVPFGLAIRATIKDREGCILLLRRSKASRSNAGVWEFPGGKIDPGENFAAALVREVKEECGLDVVPIRAVGAVQTETPKMHVVHLIMEAAIVGGDFKLSHEHDAFDWLHPRDLGGPVMIEQFHAFAVRHVVDAADGGTL